MSIPMPVFHPLPPGTADRLPRRLNNPFSYTPSEVMREVVSRVRVYIYKVKEWKDDVAGGKMFGVLICRRQSDGAVGFLAAHSGQLSGREDWEGMVPAVFDYLSPDGHFKQEEALIAGLSRRLGELPATGEEAAALREERRERSVRLQRWLFERFVVADACGGRKSVADIFLESKGLLPPAGAGECCAPKLLHHAFANGLIPLEIAEFWTGPSPMGEVRLDGEFYGACRGKCRPILQWMLRETEMEPEVYHTLPSPALPPVVYEDSEMVCIAKPAGMLSAKGKTGEPDAAAILRRERPDLDYLINAHRLDQATSGLLLLAKSAGELRRLQRLFAERKVRKEYVALLEASPASIRAMDLPKEGTVALPLLPDIYDRPRQLVSFDYGKPAHTRFRLLPSPGDRQAIALTPLTGRTHQLRIHTAHPLGLSALARKEHDGGKGLPILGDQLYGHPGPRLFLHARLLEIENHEGKIITITREDPQIWQP